MFTSTIFALSTPPGRSAIAIVRLSGPHAGLVLDALCPPPGKPRFAALRRLVDPASGLLLDEALVIYFAAPRTETGEDMAELHLHGGRAIVRAVLDALAGFPGCRPAEPGEFARRAFANGKLDLAEVEGLADLIDAETEAQRQQAIAQATGVQSARFEAWRAELLRSMGLVEAAIDFSDEGDVSEKAVAQAEPAAHRLRAELAAHLDDGHRGEILREGFRVVLAGPPNAGKSSLLNALARREAAIVSEEAGTTRDVIDVRLDLEGLAVIVSDTAGIRETSSSVEQEGIRRTLQATREADLVLWLTAADTPGPRPDKQSIDIDSAGPFKRQPTDTPEAASHRLPPAETAGRSALSLLTKCDLVPPGQTIHVKHTDPVFQRTQPDTPTPGPPQGGGEKSQSSRTPIAMSGAVSSPLLDGPHRYPPCGERLEVEVPSEVPQTTGSGVEPFDLAVSARTGAGLDALVVLIAARAREATGNPSDPAITRLRHRRELERAIVHLDAFLARPSRAIELRAEDLRLAAMSIGRLTGRIGAEDVLGEIFSRFCIGK